MTGTYQNWLLDRFAGMRVAVVGDAMLDEFVECAPRKLCSEGPVPVVWRQRQVAVPGGAANVAANLAALGAAVALVSVTGRDEAGRRLRDSLEELGVHGDLLLAEAGSRTHCKTRILADGHYVVRVDEGDTAVPGRRLRAAVERSLEEADVLVLSDYGLGVLDDRTIGFLAARRPSMPVVVDAKHPARFRRLRPTAVTPNLEEASAMAGSGKPERLARRVRRATGADLVALTLGGRGAYLLDGDGPGDLVPARPAVAESEVGAGDSFVAALALAVGAGAGARQATTVAVEAAGIAVAKRYTAVVTAAELARSLVLLPADRADGGEPDGLAELLPALERRRRRGERIVFTNGVFDLLHPGHVDLLRRARRQGDALVVAVNSDASVRRLKGPGRPVLQEAERLSLVAALDSVDHVICFDADTATELVRSVRPDVYVKGGDYTEADLPEAETARQLGAHIVILPRTLAASTTSLIQRVHRLPAGGTPATGS
jgi:D-beta-D-heptose 7-phosphate kinase / D-beta-D-heptose 1-phosphate adenosyltransferase